jgi:molybdopterin-guanine dinucleotide biosynthesis protein A
MPTVCGLILAGGKGSRLGGTNKALLEVGGKTTLARVLGALRALAPAEILVVSNDDVLAEVAGARVILDPEPHAGVLPALLAGFEAASAEVCVTAACDMPFLSAELYRFLLDLLEDQDVAIPEVEEQLEPMYAAYRRATCAAAVREALERGERRMISYFDAVRVRRVREQELRRVAPTLLPLFNINTADDLERARALAHEVVGC